MIQKKKSLVTHFIVIILLILVVGQGILYTWLLLYQKSYLERRLRDEVTATARHIADMAATAGLSSTSLEQSLEILLKRGQILSITVTDGAGRTVLAKAAQSAAVDDAKKESIGPFSVFYVEASSTVSVPYAAAAKGGGNIEVIYSGSPVNEVMRRFLVIPPVMQSITLLGIIFAIAKFFQKKVSIPVENINKVLARVTAGDLTAEVPKTEDNEIGSIASGLQFLIDRLSATIARFNSLSGNVASAMGQLTVALSHISESATKQSLSIDTVISSIRDANTTQKRITENTDRLSHASSENVSSLLEMRSAAEEIALSTGRLFKSAEDSYAMIAEMSQTSKTIAENIGEVSNAVGNVSASVEEISASLGSVEENAKRSSELNKQVRVLLTDRGTLAVADAIDAVEKIMEEVSYSSQIITRLDERSRDIEKVLSVIKEVTEKTNLLSLNAAILAAQAGEYGKGFSVVADEIRLLSDRTSASARDIATIVMAIQREIHDAVNAIRKGVKKVEEGKELIFRSGEAMGETLEAARNSSQMALVIERATEEQAQGLTQIRSSMENVRQMIQEVARATEEEGKGSHYMQDSISDVKEVAEFVKKGTQEHAVGTDIISKNLGLTSDMVSQINQSAQDQLRVNESIIAAVDQVKNSVVSSVRDMEEVTLSFTTLKDEIETLKKELAVFKIGGVRKPVERS
jgi:methyl-accepting chemotaxis protein